MKYDTKVSIENNSVKAQKVHTMRNATLNIIMWLLAFVLVLTIMAVLPMPNDNRINVNTAVAQGVSDDGTTATSFAGGTGTEEDPYQIATPMQLRLLSETTDYSTYWGSGTVDSSSGTATIEQAVYYELTADLEMTSTDWTPIGSGSQAFFGCFDGQGHTITFVNEVTTEGVLTEIGSDDCYLAGLFGYAAGGSVSNLGVNWQGSLAVENNVVADVRIGGIAGYVVMATITNCYNTGSISATASGENARIYVGGIAGVVDGTITNCYNSGSISGTASGENVRAVYVGGIAGTVMQGGTIANCYNTGSITASGENVRVVYVGGIAAAVVLGTISNCYNIGSINVTESGDTQVNSIQVSVGGVAGVVSGGTISNCFNAGSIIVSSENGDSLFAGCIAGIVEYGTISNCYNTGSISGTASGENVQMFAVGGIVGGSYMGTIVNCFSVEGQIEAIGTAQQIGVGGISGLDRDGSAITNCYYDNELVGTASTLDGTRVTGLADLMKVESNFTNGSFVDSASTSHPWSIEPIQTTDPITQEPMEIQPQWDFENVWGIDSSINNGYPYLLNMSQGGTGEVGSENQVTITNDTEKAVLVVISSDGSTSMFKVQGGATKTYTMPMALDISYKVSIIGGVISGTPTISGGDITDQQGNTFNVTFTENGSLSIAI